MHLYITQLYFSVFNWPLYRLSTDGEKWQYTVHSFDLPEGFGAGSNAETQCATNGPFVLYLSSQVRYNFNPIVGHMYERMNDVLHMHIIIISPFAFS